MAMNSYLKNISNDISSIYQDVDVLRTSAKEETDNNIITDNIVSDSIKALNDGITTLQTSTSESISTLSGDMITLQRDTSALVSNIYPAINSELIKKHDKITSSSSITCNIIHLNDLKIGTSWLKNDLAVMNNTINNKQSILNNASNIVYNNASSIISEVINFTKAPTMDTAGAILTDISIVNKKYIDDKYQMVNIRLDDYFNRNDYSIRGIHTINRENFDLFNTFITRETKALATFKFTPKNANSRLNCMFNVVYDYSHNTSGTGADQIRSYAAVYQNGIKLITSFQQIQRYVNGPGGGTRSGCLFPLHWSVRPNVINSSEITISIFIRNDGDDHISFNSSNDNALFECTEIRG
jgi:hypothetical protein